MSEIIRSLRSLRMTKSEGARNNTKCYYEFSYVSTVTHLPELGQEKDV